MVEQLTKKPSAPLIGIDVKSDFVNKVLDRLQHIGKNGKALLKDEAVLGIFKSIGYPIGHVVITNYRILGVRTAESRGNVVFASELFEKDLQSITLQIRGGWLGQRDYDVELEKNGRKSRYATVKSADVDNIVKLLEKVKSSESLPLLLEAQGRLLAEEKAERDRVKAEKKQQQKTEREKSLAAKQAEYDGRKKERELRQQAKKDIKRSAKIALDQARGSLLGKIDIKYVGGYDSERHSGSLYLYQNRLEYRDFLSEPNIVVEAKDIESFDISGRQETQSRLTVPRILALGVFALAVPKRDSVKEANVTVRLKGGRQVLFHTKYYTQYEVYKKLINGVSHYSELQANNTEIPSPAAQPDQVDLLERYAALHKKGILTDEEFKAKKKQLLGL